ncbi:hypothetical protein GCM10027047_16010 [Rhodococcus aerolatus]
MTLFSDAKGRKVVSTSTADTVGKISEFVVDPSSRSVVAVLCKKTEDGDTLRWSDITAFGDDAVTVANAGVIGSPDETVGALTGKDHHVLGKRVLTSRGADLGKVKDVEFDHESGAIENLVLDDQSIGGARLLGVGSYAVVVRAE